MVFEIYEKRSQNDTTVSVRGDDESGSQRNNIMNLIKRIKLIAFPSCYLGCFADQPTRDLSYYVGCGYASVVSCMQTCFNLNYAYAAVQVG